VEEVHARRGEALARLETRDASDSAILDSAFHALAAAFGADELARDECGLSAPQSLVRAVFRKATTPPAYAYCRVTGGSESTRVADVLLLDASGLAVVELHGLRLRSSTPSARPELHDGFGARIQAPMTPFDRR
jgi:hypothetical protein